MGFQCSRQPSIAPFSARFLNRCFCTRWLYDFSFSEVKFKLEMNWSRPPQMSRGEPPALSYGSYSWRTIEVAWRCIWSLWRLTVTTQVTSDSFMLALSQIAAFSKLHETINQLFGKMLKADYSWLSLLVLAALLWYAQPEMEKAFYIYQWGWIQHSPFVSKKINTQTPVAPNVPKQSAIQVHFWPRVAELRCIQHGWATGT